MTAPYDIGLFCDYEKEKDGNRFICALRSGHDAGHYLVKVRSSGELPTQACPECRAQKHGNCSGETWCDQMDDYVPCPCAVRSHG